MDLFLWFCVKSVKTHLGLKIEAALSNFILWGICSSNCSQLFSRFFLELKRENEVHILTNLPGDRETSIRVYLLSGTTITQRLLVQSFRGKNRIVNHMSTCQVSFGKSLNRKLPLVVKRARQLIRV